ncbi:MAG: bifunctional phosphoglucose/phosphomannose isomerase [Candidatus Marinimicrobia bacterium]|jgi:glucose/mannose-6-phosphate isomerase|nr:bifunctional phosphoglucose/phosphomannose isomerase [Candidatus Neomarinimicrobiota bacterium]MBT3618621.1 bifunctional phosphoglucose/phosphomannose isomerase [Candidatus Neomarinimicrobiota bacterium]MBT3829653.1 bifunctional phosphoglucose/phosphomannose isomerase [Candidatus Neomarinimicrobiota bacterium]MBT3997370.1 bifunctional phosphoglucose/phosphomannose isomerase [Candidatus Neomarinimicrobiota bacterium]MBT4281059.1 bifunctional phosphoglucose/phosphomannose isomerase [Candidatus
MSGRDTDINNMYQSIFEFPDHLLEAIQIGENISLTNNYKHVNGIVVAGMGGSAIGGDVTRVLTGNTIHVPMLVSRDYTLPNWVNQNTLVICSSYSGNTEETLSAFEDAVSKNAQIIGITTGGTLTEMLKANNLDAVKIPGGLQPRASLAFSFVPMLYILNTIGLITDGFVSELKNSIFHLKDNRQIWGSDDNPNLAIDIANTIYNTIPILYSDSDLSEVAAIRFKGQLNENAKIHAWCNRLPELNHNEIVGWENNAELSLKMSLVWMADQTSHLRTKIRRDITRSIVGELSANDVLLEANQDSKIGELLHLIHLGDWISYWCALKHGTDPTPVVKIDQLKDALSKLN